MSDRIPYPGIKHGDKVRLTGTTWPNFLSGKDFVVDDENYHRPVIMERTLDGGSYPWYILEKESSGDFSVTKVAE